MKGIDTAFIIDLMRNDKGAVTKALELDKEPIAFTTEANVYEIISGIWQQNINQEKALQDMGIFLSKVTVLPLDRRGAIRAGQIAAKLSKQGKMIDDIDCLTAGILLTNGCNVIVSRNTKHFERIEELKTENY